MPLGSTSTSVPAEPSAGVPLPAPILPAPGAGGRSLFLTVFPSIMLPMFMAAVDQTIVATALPAIGGTLGDIERVSWVVVAYLVANTIAAPVYGRLGDALGRKRMMFGALGVFMAASLLCAAAPSVLMLSFARLLQGVGGGGLMTLSQALIAEAVPPRQRGRYQGYLSGMYAAAATFGPVVGGWLTEHYGWPSVFLVNLPLGVLAIALVARLPAHPVRGGRLQFDLWGTVLFAAVIAPTLLALERAQRFDRGALPIIAGLAIVATVALVMLLRQEKRAPSPLLPVQMFRKPGIWRTDLLAACVAAQTVSMVTFLPMYLQVVRGNGAEASGLLLLPLTLGVAHWLVVRRAHHRPYRPHRHHPVDWPGSQRCDTGRRGAVRSRDGQCRIDRGIGADFADHRPDHAGGADDGAGGGGTAIPRRGGGLGAVLAFGRRGVRRGPGRRRAVCHAGGARSRHRGLVHRVGRARTARAGGAAGGAAGRGAERDRRCVPRRLPDHFGLHHQRVAAGLVAAGPPYLIPGAQMIDVRCVLSPVSLRGAERRSNHLPDEPRHARQAGDCFVAPLLAMTPGELCRRECSNSGAWYHSGNRRTRQAMHLCRAAGLRSLR